MSVRDMVLAAFASVVWGVAFVAAKFALESFSAPQLTAVRFLVASAPVLLVRRPAIAWSSLLLIGMTLFTGQFMLLFFAYTQGLPPGVASVTQQMQAFFTVLLAAVLLGEIPSWRQCLGLALGVAGLGLIAVTTGEDLRLTAVGLALAGAFSWAIGNILVKRAAAVPIFPLVVWGSLVPPIPALLISGLYGGPSLGAALAGASWLSLGAALYLGILATTVAYACWGSLLQRHSAAVVAPFALLAPCTGVVASAAILHEIFSPVRYGGMALILAGLAVVVLPARRIAPGSPSGTPVRARHAKEPGSP